MSGKDDPWARARQHAERFLRRYRDAGTRELRDDLVQETTLAAWRWAQRPHEPARLWAALRTIARRTRARLVFEKCRRHERGFADAGPRAVEAIAPCDEEREIAVGGRTVPVRWASARLERALRCLSSLDRQLLLGFHEGFCCAELAARFGRSEQCIKTRIHRARRRVQSELEGIVRAADDLDE